MHERDHARELGALRSGLAATAVLCVVELVGGYLTNSLALVSDAAHMFTDMAALGLTLFALWICSRPASETKTFGYYRAEILAALVNGVVLWVIVVFIVAEAWRRLHDPPPVAGRGLLALALAGLAVNAVVAVPPPQGWTPPTGRAALAATAGVAAAPAAADAILPARAAICAREFHIEHVTTQIEHESRRAAEPAHGRKEAPMPRLASLVLVVH